MDSNNSNRRGIDILADILQFCDTSTQTNILKGLAPILEKEKRPELFNELRRQIVLFDDLAYANPAGIQMLIKYVTLRDLAVALKNAPEAVVKVFANSMSKNMFTDLKNEAIAAKNVSLSEILRAKEQILNVAKSLIKEKQLYIEKPSYNKIY